MMKIKHDPEQYLRRSDIGIDEKVVSSNRRAKTRRTADLLGAVVDPNFYVTFKA